MLLHACLCMSVHVCVHIIHVSIHDTTQHFKRSSLHHQLTDYMCVTDINLNLQLTSALYILIRPEFTLVHSSTPLIPHSVFECSAKGPVFTYNSNSHHEH